MATQAQELPGFLTRWQTYCRERFPLSQYGVALAAFTWATLAYSYALEGQHRLPAPYPFFVAFIVTLLVFLQLRILDEFKDYEEDAQYRPYRPVPRGLVTLRSLGRLWFALAASELVLAASLGLAPVLWLSLILLYSGLMRVEFFVRTWLKAHAVTYMGSHMVIVPMIAAFIASCSGTKPGLKLLAPFLAFAYLNFCVFEVGRKICAPHEERTGVETYSALWGSRRAVGVWVAAMLGAGAVGWITALRVGIVLPYVSVAAVLLLSAVVIAVRFLSDLSRAKGKIFRVVSGLWLLGIHIVFGAALAFH